MIKLIKSSAGVVLFLCLACWGCMDILTQKRETVSRIKSFSITPQQVYNGDSFNINIDAEIGYDIGIYMQPVGANAANRLRVYYADKDNYDNETIHVRYSAGVYRGKLESDNKGWSDIYVDSGTIYNAYLQVCDFAVVPGNSYCETSATQVIFYNR